MDSCSDTPHVIITGTTRGLGFCLCRLYLSRGYCVTGFARSAAPIDFKSYIDESRYIHVQANLADPGNVDLIISEFLSKKSRAIILNAADYSVPDTSDPEAQLQQLNLNLLTPILLIGNILSRSYSYKPQVIYISSIMAGIHDHRHPAYGAAKSAVSGFIDNSAPIAHGKVSLLNVIAGPMYPDDSVNPFFKKLISVSYTKAAEVIFLKSGKEQTIFLPEIWRYITSLINVLGKKKMSAVINKFR